MPVDHAGFSLGVYLEYLSAPLAGVFGKFGGGARRGGGGKLVVVLKLVGAARGGTSGLRGGTEESNAADLSLSASYLLLCCWSINTSCADWIAWNFALNSSSFPGLRSG